MSDGLNETGGYAEQIIVKVFDRKILNFLKNIIKSSLNSNF